MTNELATTTQSYPVLTMEPSYIKEIMQENLGDDAIGPHNLTRISAPSSGFFITPTAEGDKTEKTVEGIIVAYQKKQVLFRTPFAQRQKGDRPECAGRPDENNVLVGSGEFDGRRCNSCPLSKFTGQGKDSVRPECNERSDVYILTEGTILPYKLSISSSGLTEWKEYRKMLYEKLIPITSVVTELGVVDKEGAAGAYKTVGDIRMVRQLSDEEHARIKSFRTEMVAQFAQADNSVEEYDEDFD